MYLHSHDNYSEYINNLIDLDLAAKQDPDYIAQRRRELKAELADLDKSEKQKVSISKECKEFLEYWLEVYKTHDRNHMEDHQNLFWIKTKIIPEAKGRGFKLNEKQVLEMFKAGRIDV
jgi:predicted metal-dependent phosphotriesterase family hydrolase